MPTGIRKLRLGFLLAALVGVMIAASAGPAAAMKLVVSDKVAFKGNVNSAGEFASFKCSLTSDGETTAFPCNVVGTALGVGSPTIEVSSRWTSADGEGFFPFVIVPRVASKPPIETYKGTGPCVEREETEPPSGAVIEYPCTVTVTLKFNTAKGTVAGKYVVREEEKQP